MDDTNTPSTTTTVSAGTDTKRVQALKEERVRLRTELKDGVSPEAELRIRKRISQIKKQIELENFKDKPPEVKERVKNQKRQQSKRRHARKKETMTSDEETPPVRA